MNKEEVKQFIRDHLTDICYGDKPKDKDGNMYIFINQDGEDGDIYQVSTHGEELHVANYMDDTGELTLF